MAPRIPPIAVIQRITQTLKTCFPMVHHIPNFPFPPPFRLIVWSEFSPLESTLFDHLNRILPDSLLGGILFPVTPSS